MATFTNQEAALKDAMIRAKEIAAKLAKEQPHIVSKVNSKTGEETRKRALIDKAPEPPPKRNLLDHDPQLVAQKVANLLQQKTGLGSLLKEEITIPNNLVGLVIGRGGEMINKLQSESGAKVQVAPDPTAENLNNDRKINITGTFEAVNTAKSIIEEIRSTGKIPEQLIIGTLPGEFSVEMLIPRGKVGLVIGKGGENIKNLQEQAGCKMVLLQDGEYANAAEKPLRMTGERNAVFYGKQLVHDLILNKELEGMNPPDGQGYKEINVPRESVGLIIGTKGANIHQIQLDTGCKIRFKNDMEGPFKIAMLSGTPQQLTDAENKLKDIISAGKAGSQRNNDGVLLPSLVGGVIGQVGGVGGFQMGSFFNSNLLPGHKNVTIRVPAKKCGLVIGKGGETIKFIKSETGIKIEIEKSSLDPHFRTFKAQGTDDMIEKALVIIREKLNDDSISSTLVQSPALQWTKQESTQVPIQPLVWTESPNFVSSWNQAQPISQPTWDTQLPQWHQVSNSPVVGNWPKQQQWVQQNVSPNQSQIIHSVPQVSNTIVTPIIDPSQMNISQSTMQQADYSAAWTNYYQQQQQQQHAQLIQQQELLQLQPQQSQLQPQQSQLQPQQYYQHYSIQQQQTSVAASGTNVPTPASFVEASSAAGTTQNISEYQGNLVEYYKQYGLVQSQ